MSMVQCFSDWIGVGMIGEPVSKGEEGKEEE